MTQKLFEIDKEVWKEFKAICAINEWKLKRKVTEAIRLFNKKYKR